MITDSGDYISNLPPVECLHDFKHLNVRTMGHSMGHFVPSDFADKEYSDPKFGIFKLCGCWTLDERAILGAICRQFPGEPFVDIGCHTGITSKTINWVTNAPVICVDPMLADHEFFRRFDVNTGFPPGWTYPGTSEKFFARLEAGDADYPTRPLWSGFVIDGDHEPGKPFQDAKGAYSFLRDTGVIIFHDFIGKPVREAVTWCMDQGMKARVYWTPHLIAVCWRGDFQPPWHEGDGRINWLPHEAEISEDFDLGRLD